MPGPSTKKGLEKRWREALALEKCLAFLEYAASKSGFELSMYFISQALDATRNVKEELQDELSSLERNASRRKPSRSVTKSLATSP